MIEAAVELKKKLRGGVSPAMATPVFDDRYTVRPDGVTQLVEFLASKGAHGLFVGGSTGEGILLDVEQRQVLHESAVLSSQGLDSPVPILLHIGAKTTREAISLAQHADEIGADAVALMPPSFFSMPDRDLLSYFVEIAAEVPDMPLFAYDIPHLAINGISPDLLLDMKHEIPNFAGVKTSRKDFQVIRKLLDAANDELIMLAGNEPIYLGSLGFGADGMISGLSTAIPEPFVALARAFFAGDQTEAIRVQRVINRILGLTPAGRRLGGIKRILTERAVPVGLPVPPRAGEPGEVWGPIEAVLQAEGIL